MVEILVVGTVGFCVGVAFTVLLVRLLRARTVDQAEEDPAEKPAQSAQAAPAPEIRVHVDWDLVLRVAHAEGYYLLRRPDETRVH